MLSPAVDSVAEQFAGKAKVGKLNVREAAKIAAQFDIEYIPQVYLFTPGTEPRRLSVNPGNKLAAAATMAEALTSALPQQ